MASLMIRVRKPNPFFTWCNRIKLVVPRNPQYHFGHTRYFSSYSREFSFLNKTSSRTFLFAVAGSAFLGCVLVLRQKNKHVSCEEKDTTGESVPREVRNAGTLNLPKPEHFKPAIDEARTYLEQVREQTGAPGLVISVSVDGKSVWSEGMGYADVENHVKCNADTVMRIASISKPLTALAVAKLYEENKLDVDAPIQKYVPTFPQKHFNGQPVTITTRQLLSHLGGLRHYQKTLPPKNDSDELKTTKQESKDSSKTDEEKQEESENAKQEGKDKAKARFNEEYYIKEPKTMQESLAIFQDDPLLVEPGESFLYTTYGYTLISAVVESLAQEDFLSYTKKLFRELEMNDTGPDMNDKITYNRSRFYQHGKRNGLINTPYVNNSYKWAGGGFVSTVNDLVKFGNAMLYAYQVKDCKDNEMLPGILKPETVNEMLRKVDKNEGTAHKDGWYGWGWYILPDKQTHGACRHQKETIFHTGVAVGAVSILLIRPDNRVMNTPTLPPRGIVVSIIMNLQEISKNLQATAEHVADIFDKNVGQEWDKN